MNGRLYDPVVGRFLSPDPFIQYPSNTQSYNRYSYCLNNPLKYTDPSGYTWWSKFWNWTSEKGIQFGINMGPRGLTPNMSVQGPGNTRMAFGYNMQTERVGFGNNSSGFMQFYFPQMNYDVSAQDFVNKTIPNVRARYGDEWHGNSGHGVIDPYQYKGDQDLAFLMSEFIAANKGLTREQIINQMDNRSKTFLNSQQGGPYMRYVRNPHDGKVLDMRHMLIVGNLPPAVGNFVEVGQWLRGQASGMNPQDFYSNGVGYQFYMQYSGLQNFFYPEIFTNQLQNFFYKPRVIINY